MHHFLLSFFCLGPVARLFVFFRFRLMDCKAFRAASSSASFLLRPDPEPSLRSATSTETEYLFLWEGPFFAINQVADLVWSV